MGLVAHAQNAGEPHRIVFQSDRSGNIVKRIPVTIGIDAAYHQMITNEFRKQWPYGKGPLTPEKAEEISKYVYDLYQLP